MNALLLFTLIIAGFFGSLAYWNTFFKSPGPPPPPPMPPINPYNTDWYRDYYHRNHDPRLRDPYGR